MPKPKPKKSFQPNNQPVLSLKERLAQKRKAAQARQAVISSILTTAAISIVVGLLIAIVGGVKGAVGGGLGVFCLMMSFKYPWQALYGFLIYMPFSGTITYSIGSNSPLLQLAKDAFFIPALIAIVQYCKRHKQPVMIPKSLVTPMGLLLAYCLLVLVFVNGSQQFSGSAGTDKPFLMGLLGLKVLLGYVPLIPCAYYMVRKKQDLHLLMRVMTALVIICCGLAFVQYLLLETGRCQGTVGEGAALFKASLEARCFVGGSLLYAPEQGVIRLPGTFVAPWQWGWFLISSAFFSFAVTFMDPSILWRGAGLSAMIGTLTLSVVSGQRIALILVPIVIIILLITTGQVANLKRFIPIAVGLGLILSFVIASNPAVVQERIDSAVGRWNAAPPTDFIASQFGFVHEGTGFLGKGVGRATNSARTFGETTLIETYYPKLLFEIGPIGVILFLVVVTTLTIATFKAYRSVRDRSLRGYGAALWTFILVISYNTYYYPLDVDPVAVYYWFFAGIILKLPELDQQEPEPSDALPSKKSKHKKPRPSINAA
ncbi:MAG: hypothetical protein HC780_16585 [Leptolyngbyaceae cyanobacterium CSU_1_3]|nr:hypothetical protein [Leptolyngbyaceae cyanobacterium CSU_1_3]